MNSDDYDLVALASQLALPDQEDEDFLFCDPDPP